MAAAAAEGKEEKERKKKNYATKMDSCDTLADVDMNFKEMRTCDGPCKALSYSDLLELYECGHAVCGECLNELTDIEVRTGKFLCPVSTCRHGNAERNISSVKEYNYLKERFLRSRNKINYSTTTAAATTSEQQLTNSSAEASISMVNILQFDKQQKDKQDQTSLPLSSTKERERKAGKSNEYGSNKSEKEEQSMTFESSKIISGTTLIYPTKLNNQESCTSISTTSDYYEETGPSTNPLIPVTDSDYSSRTTVTKKPSAYPINASEYDEDLVAELQALTCKTAKPCFYEDDFNDCTTAQTFSNYD